jgi:serine/threonine protein kinase
VRRELVHEAKLLKLPGLGLCIEEAMKESEQIQITPTTAAGSERRNSLEFGTATSSRRNSFAHSPELSSGTSGSGLATISSQHQSSAGRAGKKLRAMASIKPPAAPFVDVRLLRLVGSGGFGKVYQGTWMGASVAVKLIEMNTNVSSKFDPAFEAFVSTTISHPNLVQTFKYSSRSKPTSDMIDHGGALWETWIVQEWCERGTLFQYCNKPRCDEACISEVVGICTDIVGAGHYLHSRGIIHGDLSANNVLLKAQTSRKSYVCKICDFGLAQVMEEAISEIQTTRLGTVTYMPPELFDISPGVARFSPKVDVYSSGILLWQVLSGKAPYDGFRAAQVIVQVSNGQRLRLPDGTCDAFHRIFDQCVAINPEERPAFEELYELYVQLVDAHGIEWN